MARKTKAVEPRRTEVPDKIYYSIREVSQYTGVPPHVLRYWETKFTRLTPERAGGNQRKYTKADLEVIFEIKELLHGQGFTLSGAEKHLKNSVKKKAGRAGASHEEVPAAKAAHPASPGEDSAPKSAQGALPVPRTDVAPAGGLAAVSVAVRDQPSRTEASPQPPSATGEGVVRMTGQLSEIRRELRKILELVS